MVLQTSAIGKQFPAVTYEVGSEKVREYARAIGAENPVHLDREAAIAAGYRDLVAPPMFCVVYCAPSFMPALFDPEVAMDFAKMVHGGQEFRWAEPVCAGDTISTTIEVSDIAERAGNGFYVFETTSINQDGATAVEGTWTNIVRGV